MKISSCFSLFSGWGQTIIYTLLYSYFFHLIIDPAKISISFQSFLKISYGCIVFHYRYTMIYLTCPLLMIQTQEFSAHNLCDTRQKLPIFQYPASNIPLSHCSISWKRECPLSSLFPNKFTINLDHPLECDKNGWFSRILRTHLFQPWTASS